MAVRSNTCCILVWLLGVILGFGVLGCSSKFESTELAASSQSDIATGNFCGGAGTPEDPYLICTARQLGFIDGDRRKADGTFDRSARGKSFRIARDLDLNSIRSMDRSYIGYFEGHLDGGGHTLRNFGLNNQVARPLIGFNTGVIENLSLVNFSVQGPAVLVGSNYFLYETVDGLQTETLKDLGLLRNLRIAQGNLFAVGNFVISAGVVVGLNNAGVSDVRVENVTITVSGEKYSGGGVGCIAGYSGISGFSEPFIHVKDSQIVRCSIINSSPQAGWALGSAVGFNADAPTESITVTDSGSLPLVGREL